MNVIFFVDEDYVNIIEVNLEYYWFCWNSLDFEININGNLFVMLFVLVLKEYSGEVICDGFFVIGNCLLNK